MVRSDHTSIYVGAYLGVTSCVYIWQFVSTGAYVWLCDMYVYK